MKSPRWVRIAAFVVFPLLLGGCEGADGNADEVRIAIVGPMETSYGVAMRRATDMAVERINSDGGINGRTLTVEVRDDGMDESRAIEIASELKEDPAILAVVGHVTSAATLAAARVYNDGEDGLLEISPTASSPELSEAGDWTFRVCPSDLEHGPALARLLNEDLAVDRAEVLYANDGYGRGLQASFSEAFIAAGGQVVGRDPFLPEYTQNEGTLDPYFERATNAGIGGMVIASLVDEAIAIIRTARDLGYEGSIVGADGLLGIQQAGEVAEGVYVSAPFLPDPPAEEARAFVDSFSQRYGEEPDAFAALSYDAVGLVAEAIRDAGADRRAIRDHVANLRSEADAYHGVTGAIRFDENGDVVNKRVVIGVVRDGRIVAVSGAS